jgi:MFS family permease
VSKKFIPAYLLTFVNVLGFSILIPILPFIVESYNAPEWVFGLLITLYSAFQFIGAPILGSMSDSYGRKKILIISQAGTLASWIVFLIALLLPENHWFGIAIPLIVIALARSLDGITGGNSSVANAYVSDITTRKEKAYIFGYLGGIAGIGMILGPGLGGITATSPLGFIGTLLTCIIISAVTLVSIILWLKESHPPEKRVTRVRQPLWNLLYIPGRVKTVNPSRIVKSIFTIKMLFSSMMGFYIGTMALFLIDLFSFDEMELGLFLFVAGAFLAFNQAFVSEKFVKKFGEFPTLIVGLLLCGLGMMALTISDNIYVFIGFYYILNLGLSLCFPTFNALISIHADEKKQGAVMGISESIGSFAMAVFPVISAVLYGFIGFKFYIFVGVLPLVALIIAIFSLKKYGRKAFG